MVRMINANHLIEAIQAKIDFRKRYLIFRTEHENKEDMAEIKAYEDVIDLVKANTVDISTLYEDCENGAEDDVILGWNRALDKVAEVMKAGGSNE